MRDGRTKRLKTTDVGGAPEAVLKGCQVSLLLLSGESSGTAFVLRKTPVIVGRGPGVDIAINDVTMSRQHLIFELVRDGFRVRDLGSTNGISVNGESMETADLQHGDRLKVGDSELAYLVEEAHESPRTYEVQE
jgi:pSer/pThr/pTyr-binding forkhead associated (FHA) protein